MSSTYIRNSKGPSIDLWGTPHVTFNKDDLVASPKFGVCQIFWL